MVETDFRPEERAPDEPDPDDPGLFIPDGTKGLPVVDENGRRVGELTDGYVLSGSIEQITFRVDPEVRKEWNLPEMLAVEAWWIKREEDRIRLNRSIPEMVDDLGFERG